MILSVGYRVNSLQATKFRQWATSVLKNYITNGYAINSDKITHDRFVSLEDKVSQLSSKIDILQTKDFKSNGIFFNGQIFDAYTFISDLIRSAKKEIILIDNYIDDTILNLFSKVPNIKVTIYTHTISKTLKQDLKKYNLQYSNIIIKIFKDNNELYNIGASLKDVGKKWFAFSKLDISSIKPMIEKLD